MKELYENTYLEKNHFSFGKNWKDFLKNLNRNRIEEAKRSLVNFLGGKDKIKEKSFVDIGCGSGLFSLAAYLIGAKQVTSIDIDNYSLTCAKHLKKIKGNPKTWKIIKGSVLDQKFTQQLGRFDIVYSWGVLHHSGNMYKAFDNIVGLVKPKGRLYIAIYNENTKIVYEGTSKFWLKIKRIYNNSEALTKLVILYSYVIYFVLGLILSGKNPYQYIKNYQSARGMNWLNDIKDWIGGYPYEYASIQTITNYFNKLGFKCIKTTPARSIGCNEYLFIRK